jgi:hypothetical protein
MFCQILYITGRNLRPVTESDCLLRNSPARTRSVTKPAGRLHFHEPVTGDTSPHKNCGGPMVIACYGAAAVERARRLEAPGSPYPGHLVTVRPRPAKAARRRQVPRG